MAWSDRSYADEGPLFRGGGGALGPTAWLVVINVAVSVLLWIFGGGAYGGGTNFAIKWLSFRTDIGADAFWQIWRPFSYQFLHGRVSHLFWNMVMLWFTGKMLEEVYGPRRLIGLFLGFGAVASLGDVIHQLIVSQPLPPVIGASGSIIGLVVLMGFTFPQRQIIVFVVRMSCAVFAALLVAIDILSVIADRGNSDTAHTVHLGGAFAGFAFAWLWPRFEVKLDELQRDRQRIRRAAEADSRARDDVEMDRILEKINQEGMSVLTEKEREFLKRQSERLRGR